MLKLVCFAFALSAAGSLEKVPLGTYYDAYSANRAILRALDKHDGPPPTCQEYVQRDGKWEEKAPFDPRDVSVVTGYDGLPRPGELRLRYHITIREQPQ